MIPISQNLQLASQSNVTPWELPYEELFAGLANKQKTFNDRVESIGALNELFPEGGIFTKDAASKFKEDYMGRITELEESLNNEGKVDPLSIKKLARDITTDDRMSAFKHDKENLTPWYLKAKVSGELISGVNNMTNPSTGEPVQVSSMEELANLQHIPNQDYNHKFNERVSKYIQPFQSALETRGVIQDPKTNQFIVSKDYEEDGIKWTKGDVLETKNILQMFDKVINGQVVKDAEGNVYQGSSFVDNLMSGNDLDIVFFKELYKQRHGLQTEEELRQAYISDVVLPNLNLHTYENRKTVRAVDILKDAEEKVNSGGTGDQENLEDNSNTKELTYAMKVGQKILEIMGIEENKVHEVNLSTLSNSIDELEGRFNTALEGRKTTATNMNDILSKQESSSLSDLMSSFNIPQENASSIIGEWFNISSDGLGNLKVDYNQSTLEKATSTLTTPDKLKLYKEVVRLKNNIEVNSEDYELNFNIIELNKGMYSSFEQINTLKDFRNVMLESSSAVEKVNTIEGDLEDEYYTKKTDYKQGLFNFGYAREPIVNKLIESGIDLREYDNSNHFVKDPESGEFIALGDDFVYSVQEAKTQIREEYQNKSSELWNEKNTTEVLKSIIKSAFLPNGFIADEETLNSAASKAGKQLFLHGEEYLKSNSLEVDIAEDMGYNYVGKVEDLKGVIEKEKQAAVSDKLEQELNSGQKDKIETIIQNALTKKVMLTAGYAFDMTNIHTHFKTADLNVRGRVADNMVNSITSNYSVVGQEGKLTLTQLGEELSEDQLKYYNEFIGGVEATSKETDGNIQIVSKINANKDKPYNIKPIYYRDDSSGDWYLAIHVPGIAEEKPKLSKGKEYLNRNNPLDLVSIKLEKKEQEDLERNLKFNFKGDSEEVVVDSKRTKMLGEFKQQGYTKTDLFRDDTDPNNDVKATYTYNKIGNNIESTLYLGDTKIGVPISFTDVKGAATLEYHLQDLSDNIEEYRELIPAEEFKDNLINRLELFLDTEGNSYDILDEDLTKIINHIYQIGVEDVDEKK